MESGRKKNKKGPNDFLKIDKDSFYDKKRYVQQVSCKLSIEKNYIRNYIHRTTYIQREISN